MHLTSFPQPIPGVSLNDEERARWEIRFSVRQEVYKALEEARAARLIGSSLEAKVIVEAPDRVAGAVAGMEDPDDYFIVSQLDVKPTGNAPTKPRWRNSWQTPGVRFPRPKETNAPGAGCGTLRLGPTRNIRKSAHAALVY